MRFLGNMGISPRTIEFLRGLGYDAVHLHEQRLDTLPDAVILEKARIEGAVLLTCDLDFGELAVAAGNALPSVVIFRLKPPMRADKVNGYLKRVIDEHKIELNKGALISVSERQIRVRHLPLGAGTREEPQRAGLVVDTRALEREIDQLVYQRYGLTPAEIAIVEEKNHRETPTPGMRP